MYTSLDIANPQVQGIVILLTGILIRYIINQRKFNRRGLGGLQHFDNYFTAVITLFFEWLFKWIAYAMVISGLLRMIFG